MSNVTKIGRVLVPVGDQDDAIKFYTDTLGFKLVADIPFAEGERWIEVAPPSGDTAISLAPARGKFQTGHVTGIALQSTDVKGDYAELKDKGVDVDEELMGGDGTVPMLFFFRDNNKNQLMIVEAR